jgi:hypothetical protein
LLFKQLSDLMVAKRSGILLGHHFQLSLPVPEIILADFKFFLQPLRN